MVYRQASLKGTSEAHASSAFPGDFATAGITVRPHELRHAGITEPLDLTNGNTRAVQRYSRHRDMRILNLYDDNRTDLGGDVARLVAANA